MKNSFYLFLLLIGFSSCSKYLYTPTPKDEAQAMINHFRTSSNVSHDFNVQIKQFMVPSKVISFLSKTSDKIYFRNAAYVSDHSSGDPDRKANMMTLLIWLADKENHTKEVIDIRDIEFKKQPKTRLNYHILNIQKPTCLCPPPVDCLSCDPD